MNDIKQLPNMVNELLSKHGFQKKNRSWYHLGKDAILVIKLEYLPSFSMYAINIGFWLLSLGNITYPLFNKCHMYYRIENLFPEDRELIMTILDEKLYDDKLLFDFEDFLDSKAIPHLIEWTDENKLRELLGDGVLNRGLMMKEARNHLSKL